MTPQEKEKFYDDEIAPTLAKLSRQCTAKGLSFLSVVEFNVTDDSGSEFGRTLGLAKGSSWAFRWMDLFVRTNANFERFTMAFVKHVVREKVPHTSMYLMQLGIDPDPAKRLLPLADGRSAEGGR